MWPIVVSRCSQNSNSKAFWKHYSLVSLRRRRRKTTSTNLKRPWLRHWPNEGQIWHRYYSFPCPLGASEGHLAFLISGPSSTRRMQILSLFLQQWLNCYIQLFQRKKLIHCKKQALDQSMFFICSNMEIADFKLTTRMGLSIRGYLPIIKCDSQHQRG